MAEPKGGLLDLIQEAWESVAAVFETAVAPAELPGRGESSAPGVIEAEGQEVEGDGGEA